MTVKSIYLPWRDVRLRDIASLGEPFQQVRTLDIKVFLYTTSDTTRCLYAEKRAE